MEPGKYIVLNEQHIIIFDPAMGHAEVAQRFAGLDVSSAGFIVAGVTPDGNPDVSCYGRSVTLKLVADPEGDTRLARFALNIW